MGWWVGGEVICRMLTSKSLRDGVARSAVEARERSFEAPCTTHTAVVGRQNGFVTSAIFPHSVAHYRGGGGGRGSRGEAPLASTSISNTQAGSSEIF